MQRLKALWDLWGPWPLEPGRSLASRITIGLRFPLLVAGLWGFWRVRREPQAWLLVVPVVVLTMLHVVFFGHPRFVLPAEPFLAIVMLGGLEAWNAEPPTLGGSEPRSLRASENMEPRVH